MMNSEHNDISSVTINQPKPKNRCHTCDKKVGLLGFECRCGGIYCSSHRYNIEHNCTYDYKLNERKHLAEANPRIVADKVIKI